MKGLGSRMRWKQRFLTAYRSCGPRLVPIDLALVTRFPHRLNRAIEIAIAVLALSCHYVHSNIGAHSQGEHLCLSLIHISEPTRLLSISYAVFCLKKKNK